MSIFGRVLVTVLLSLSLGSSARAASLSSPMVFAVDPDTLYCSVVNAGAKPVKMTVRFMNRDGVDVTLGGMTTCTAVPQYAFCAAEADMEGGEALASCQVSVTGSAKKVRAGVWVVDGEVGFANTRFEIPFN